MLWSDNIGQVFTKITMYSKSSLVPLLSKHNDPAKGQSELGPVLCPKASTGSTYTMMGSLQGTLDWAIPIA